MKKAIFSIFLIAMLISSVFCMHGSAESAEIIDSAVVDAVLNADGTVNVTEKWTVSYITSSDNFYRNIDIYLVLWMSTVIPVLTAFYCFI